MVWRLSPPDFATLLTYIPGAASRTSHLTVQEQSAEVLRGAKAPTGQEFHPLRRPFTRFGTFRKNVATDNELGNDRAPPLYDLDADPEEARNVAGDYPEVAERLRKELDSR
jgi:hypothetical protein